MDTKAKAPNDTNREQVEIGKLVAEMLNLIEDTRKKEDEREKLRAETAKMQDERDRLRAEAMKLQVEAQTLKLRHVIAAYASALVFFAAIVAAVKAFL